MKEINTSTYTFEKLIKNNCLYVDKTEYIYNLISKTSGQFFCSRPRRFGKSLTISTFEAVFEGKEDLFKGLSICRNHPDYSWDSYPVIHIDFADIRLSSLSELNESLCSKLSSISDKYNVSLSEATAATMFRELIEVLSSDSKGVVLLIDEYDKPILDHLSSKEEAAEYRRFMDDFYQVIKGAEKYLRFTFITGVSRFAKVSIFSQLNNLTDISGYHEYADMFGYTHDELLEYFDEYFDDAVSKGIANTLKEKLTKPMLLDEIRKWYDGFRFTDDSDSVYNPVSIGQFINSGYQFKNYWFSTGTPVFLMNLLKANALMPDDLSDTIMSSSSLEVFDIAELAGTNVSNDKIVQILFQTGYLTIKDTIPAPNDIIYELKYPNLEVEYSIKKNLLDSYSNSDTTVFGFKLKKEASSGNTQGMIDLLKWYFSGFPYTIQINDEKYYQSLIKVIFDMTGIELVAEETTNVGRIDGVLTAGNHLYIIEFKLNKTADEAIQQINSKKYAEKYIIPANEKGITIHKVGINFCYSRECRNISDWKEE